MNETIDLYKTEAHAIIDRVIGQLKHLKGGAVEETCPIGIISMENWEWPQGVGLFSLYLYYRKTTKQDIKQYLIDWFDRRIAEGLPSKNVNTMCPMLTLSFLAEETGREDYMALCREWAEYAVMEMPRTEEGGIQHVVSGQLNEGELWDDTLYMTVLFVCRMGLLLKEESYIDESIYQFLLHIKYLTDRRTGLLFHGWTFNGCHHFAEALWARGNSWYTAGLVDYLEMIELPMPVKRLLLSALEQQASKLAELQAVDGMWHTLLDDPNSYTETSATAAFAYGILKAVRKGYLSESYREVGMKAYNAVVSKIDEGGVVHGVSYGTGMGRTLQAYRDIPICPMPYGQSMTLLMLIEGLEH
ncbi:glycoside hydrolase family 88 protein [Paenibacillus sp. KQZ6P-2]|uniref:Glycoside hydrolase family 88 protein n=1 Tax=Paenibacillus mangrovi TaxID=2931978 RepID=A0A9X2B4E9_9BACL|nr:glycoside hydrolase family 88 protein [Paenibacillus mangrovi]MCJ8014446.1 glycoside hydrolase family 88 protein [Paenibacillus mangrovi]